MFYVVIALYFRHHTMSIKKDKKKKNYRKNPPRKINFARVVHRKEKLINKTPKRRAAIIRKK